MKDVVAKKVRLTISLVEYAFSDHYLHGDPDRTRAWKRDLKKKLRDSGSIITGRRLKQVVRTFSAETNINLRDFLNRRNSLTNAHIDMVLLLTLPAIYEVLNAHCIDAAKTYATREISEIIKQDVQAVSRTIDVFKRENKSRELLRWSHYALHLQSNKIVRSNRYEYWVTVDEDATYEAQRVDCVVFYIPTNVASLEETLKHPAMESVRQLCDMWSPQTFTIESKSDSVIDVVIIRRSIVAHSRYFADGRQGEEPAMIFLERPLASIPISS